MQTTLLGRTAHHASQSYEDNTRIGGTIVAVALASTPRGPDVVVTVEISAGPLRGRLITDAADQFALEPVTPPRFTTLGARHIPEAPERLCTRGPACWQHDRHAGPCEEYQS